MTPTAAILFRTTDSEKIRSALAAAQFFECSALTSMAYEMVLGDVENGCGSFSDMAQLPAPMSVFEFMQHGVRLMIIAQQDGDAIIWDEFYKDGNEAVWFTESGFRLGTDFNFASNWDQEYVQHAAAVTGRAPQEFMQTNTRATNGLLEKILCIINQPGLVDRRDRQTDKRVLRHAASVGIKSTVSPFWHECSIRPGQHGKPSEGSDGAPRQLHYVRKHWKPSVQKWIDGYWRGNADLGVYLKWYQTSSLRQQREVA